MQNKSFFKLTNNKYQSFFKHWVLECLTIALLHYIIGEAIYIVSRAITSKIYGVYDPSNPSNPNFMILDSGFDNWLPFVKEFIIPYTTAYAYWVIGPFLVYGFMGRKRFYQFIVCSITINILSVIIFVLLPNGIAPNFRPIITDEQAKSNFLYSMCQWTFTTDSFDQTFPSGHWCLCLLLMHAFRGSYFKKNIKCSQRITAWFLWIYGILVCLSTLFVKQHYIFDGFLSVALCELGYVFFTKSAWGQNVAGTFEKYMYLFNCKLGLIKDKNIQPCWSKDKNKFKSKKFWLIYIVWFIWIGLTFFCFWETQWFIQEFLLNVSVFSIWLVGVYVYYFFHSLYVTSKK